MTILIHGKLKFFSEKLLINRAVLIHYVQDLSTHKCGYTIIYWCLFGTHGKGIIWSCGLNYTCISLNITFADIANKTFLFFILFPSLSSKTKKKLLLSCLQYVAWQRLDGLGDLYHYNMTSFSLQHSRSQKNERKVIIWGMRGSRAFHLHVHCAHRSP